MWHYFSKFSLEPLTQSLPIWAKIWLFPLALSAVCWTVGRFMPWEYIYLYPIQAILLTLPVWLMGLWLPWGMCCVLWWRKHFWILPICAMGLGWPFSTESNGDSTTLLVANVNAFSGRSQFLQSYVGLMHVDIAVLIERRADEIEGMTRAADDFSTPVARTSHHIAVFCRDECDSWVSGQIGSPEIAMSYALVSMQTNICVVAIHAPPPVPKSSTGMRPYIEHIVKYIKEGRLIADWEVCSKGDKAFVIGDFNAVPDSWPYRTLINTGLRDIRSNYGIWGTTWPTGSEAFVDFPFFRIDHILAGDIEVGNIQTVDIPDSDHRGFRVEFPKE